VASAKTKVVINKVGNFYGIGSEDDAFPSIPLVSTFKTKSGAWMVTYWLPWHPQEMIKTATVDVRVSGATYKDPVLVDILEGDVFDVEMTVESDGMTVFRNVPLADYPLAIVERGEIEFEK
jgi:hypothetical protein